MILIQYLLILSMTFTSNPVKESIAFDLYQDTELIGELQASRYYTQRDKVIYDCQTEATTSFLFDINISSSSKVSMLAGKMLSSEINVAVSGFTFASNSKEFCEEACAKDHLKECIDHEIDFTATMLFFKEPIDISNVYNELLGTYSRINKTGAHSYSSISSDNHLSTYEYRNGQLVDAYITTKDVGFILKRRHSGNISN